MDTQTPVEVCTQLIGLFTVAQQQMIVIGLNVLLGVAILIRLWLTSRAIDQSIKFKNDM